MPRGNIDNLRAPTSEEARERGRKGGLKSGESRRARKTLKEELLALLSEGDIQEKISLAILEKAKAGDTKAYEIIRDTVGEKPVEKLEAKVEETTIKISLDEEEE